MDSLTTQGQTLLPGLLLSSGAFLLYRGGMRLYRSLQAAKGTPESVTDINYTWTKERIIKEVCTVSMTSVGVAALYFALRDSE